MSPFSEYTILVVEDEEALREILSKRLAGLGFRVLEAKNGKAAFEVIQDQDVHLVISDVRMPGGSGVDLLKSLQTLQKRKPVVVLMSGFADIETEEALNSGARALISKPFNFDVLLNVIKEITK